MLPEESPGNKLLLRGLDSGRVLDALALVLEGVELLQSLLLGHQGTDREGAQRHRDHHEGNRAIAIALPHEAGAEQPQDAGDGAESERVLAVLVGLGRGTADLAVVLLLFGRCHDGTPIARSDFMTRAQMNQALGVRTVLRVVLLTQPPSLLDQEDHQRCCRDRAAGQDEREADVTGAERDVRAGNECRRDKACDDGVFGEGIVRSRGSTLLGHVCFQRSLQSSSVTRGIRVLKNCCSILQYIL